MAIFPQLSAEAKVQVDDKTRLDVSGSFVTQDESAISLIRIRPSASDSFIDVTTKKYLDWAYSTDGTKTITVEVTTDGAPETKDFTLESITEADDCLFSSDSMLLAHEGEILKYVRRGRNSWLDKHREAQEAIIEYLDEAKIWKKNTDDDLDQYARSVPMPYTKTDICALQGDDFEQFQRWSKFMVLEMIYSDLQKQVDDVFAQKSEKYRIMKDRAKNRGVLRLDKDGDGSIEFEDFNDIGTGMLSKL